MQGVPFENTPWLEFAETCTRRPLSDGRCFVSGED